MFNIERFELIHADNNNKELRQFTEITGFDAVDSMVKASDFQLTLPTRVYQAQPVKLKHRIYMPDTGWGGIVGRIKYQGDTVELGGYLWRGLLDKNVIPPPLGESYLKVSGRAEDILYKVLGNYWLGFYKPSNSSVLLSGELRYHTTREALEMLVKSAKARLDLKYDGISGKVIVDVVPVKDWSEEYELSSDFGVGLVVELNDMQTVTHIMGLGRGELVQRTVVEGWRLDSGKITFNQAEAVQNPSYFITARFDYPNAESADELKKAITEQLNMRQMKLSTEVDIKEASLPDLQLGDIIPSREYVTGFSAKQCITSKILKIKADGNVTTTYELMEVKA